MTVMPGGVPSGGHVERELRGVAAGIGGGCGEIVAYNQRARGEGEREAGRSQVDRAREQTAHHAGADERLSLAVPARVGRGLEELHRCAQPCFAGDSHGTAGDHRAVDHREVHAQVRATIQVEKVVRSHPVVVDVDAESVIAVDRVAQNRVPRSRSDRYSVREVEGDDVFRAGRRSADERVARTGDVDAMDEVGESRAARSVYADVVALDDVVRSPAAQSDPGPVVPGQDVACARRAAADDVAGGVVQPDAILAVADRAGAAGVGADVVALHQVVARAVDVDAVDVVTGDDVAVSRCGSTDQIGIGGHPDAVHVIAEVGVAGRVESDVVALDQVAAVAGDIDPGTVEPVDHQAPHGAVAREDGEPVHPGACQLPVQLDQRRAGKARLSGCVQNHRIGDHRQRRQ